ncbi:MBL fold metallo-hydrolase [Falsirhodobacter algicola]|uniref:MBL fold metallo-hydrolase n=1 Tax=Falsirhodobacter algicola TaxID=2692330 RepID=A0A8J8MRV4_9RHOB|nr:MBL fold metallo-hydrolase [Falsirhodobacter algicola]QUS35284.1 MBL fold metallo-hydrolase [Falsirhodobacter algicola]
MTTRPNDSRINEGMWAWRQPENHNHMIAVQSGAIPLPEAESDAGGTFELAYFGGSAFRITAPSGVTLMIDPWRNLPIGNWDWYHYDFPRECVDIVLSTHAHFDHDAVHMVSASVVLDRLIGTYAFGDVRITGIADKHVSDSTHNAYDWAEMTRRLTPIETDPETNWRSYDNCLLLIETAGMRILHWGDNRPDAPRHVWDALGEIDVLLLPVDGSEHVLSDAQADEVARRLKAKVIVPHHYGIWNLTARASTMLPCDAWVDAHPNAIRTESGTYAFRRDFVMAQSGRVVHFGDHLAFTPPLSEGPEVKDRRNSP